MGNSGSSATAPATITVYVTYVPTKLDRHVTLPKGSTKTAFVEEFLKCFKGVAPHESIDHFKFMWFDGTAFVELPENQVLQDKDIIKVLDLQVSIVPSVRPHPINDNKEYYLWSFVSQENDGILKKGQLDPSNNYAVKSDGFYNSADSSVHFEARDVTVAGPNEPPLFIFTLPTSTSTKFLALKGQGENLDVILEEIDESVFKGPSPTHKEFKFVPLESFSYTQFRCLDVGGRIDLCITSSKKGELTLTKGGGEPGYPKPSTLFIAMI